MHELGTGSFQATGQVRRCYHFKNRGIANDIKPFFYPVKYVCKSSVLLLLHSLNNDSLHPKLQDITTLLDSQSILSLTKFI